MELQTTRLTKADCEALTSLRQLVRRFLHGSAQAARKVGLTPQQHQVLLAVRGQRGRNWAYVAELAAALQVRHHAAVQLVDRSVRAGLVERTVDPEDHRRVRVTLTRKGAELLDEISHHDRSELTALRRLLRSASSSAPTE